MAAFSYRHIIWDWNGTLFDDAWLCVDIVNGMLARRAQPPLTPDRYETIFDFPVQDYYARAGFDFSREPFEQLSNEFIDAYHRRVHECDLRPGARAALEAARAQGISQSILSAMQQTSLHALVEHFGLRPYFTDVIGLDNHHAAGKVDLARTWIAAQPLAPSEMVLVGDTVHDFDVAQALGVDCLHVHSGHHSRQRLTACGTTILDDLAALIT